MSSMGKLLEIPLTRSVYLQHCYEPEKRLWTRNGWHWNYTVCMPLSSC